MIYASIKRQILQGFKALLSNRNCLICQQNSHQRICNFCLDDLPRFTIEQDNLLNSVAIRQYLKQLEFDRLIALSPYQWPVSHLITGLKFANKTLHAQALAEAIYYIQLIKQTDQWPQLLLPVPLHRSRFATRQYNQAALLTKHLSQLTSIPWQADGLIRSRPTKAQTDITGHQRTKNLKNAFTVNTPITCQHIALIDDVVTTGSTVSAISKMLKQHYPNLTIDVWAICVSLEHQ